MSVVGIQGISNGRIADVTSDNRLQADVEELQRIVEPVKTLPDIVSVAQTSITVPTTASDLISARSGRRWIEIQNVGANDVCFKIGSTATTNDRRLKPGEVFRGSEVVSFAEKISAVTDGATASRITVMELFK